MMNVPGGPTPAEVMAVSLLKLCVRSGDVAADLGCGTGTVTREIAKTASYVYAVDAREIAVSCTKEICAGLPVEIIEGEVTDFLSRPHRKIDCAFLGGSRNLAETLTLLAEEGTRSIVVNAVLLETACLAIETMKRLGIFSDALHLQVSRSYELTKRTMFKPINPVYIIHGENRC